MDKFRRKLNKLSKRVKHRKTPATPKDTPKKTDTRPPSKLYGNNPKVGLVIGTYGSPEYIHLHLVTAKQLYPSVSILVHDDCSPHQEHLQRLCDEYRVEFTTSPKRLQWDSGDIRAFAYGIKWGYRENIEILVKLSRRFLPLTDFVADLKRLAIRTQHPTFSNICIHDKFGFRTDAVAVSPSPWIGLYDKMIDFAVANAGKLYLVEGIIYQWATQIRSDPSFITWDFISNSRHRKNDKYLWHQTSPRSSYEARAQELKIPWTNTALGY